MKSKAFIGVILTLPYAGLVIAQPTPSNDIPKWSGNLSLGYLSTSGNTEKTTATGGLDLTRQDPTWRDHFKLNAIYSRDSGETTASRYQGSYQRDFKISGDSRYLFGRTTALKDQFSGYNYVLTASAGYGFRAWRKTLDYSKQDAHLDLEVGPGYRYARIKPEDVDSSGDSHESNATARTAAKFLFPLSATAKFSQNLEATFTLSGQHNIEGQSETALVANVMDSLALKLSYSVYYVENPPDAKKPTDTQTEISLIYQI